MEPGVSFQQSPSGVSYPSFDGSLFLPEMVEFNAKHNPTHPFYTFHDGDIDGLRHISHLEFYPACQRVAHAVRPKRQGPDKEAIAIIASCDTILYQSLAIGVIYAGLIPFPMSPRNSPAAVVNMLQKSGCRRLMVTRHSLGPLLDDISAEFAGLRIEELPTLAHTYPKLGNETEESPFVPYPKPKGRPLKNEILFYLHSSGSTGFPKPIPITNLTAVQWCIMPSMQDHVDLPKHITIGAASLPSFHMMGTLLQLFFPIASLKSVAVFPPTSYHDPIKAPIMPNPQNTIEVTQSTKSNSLVVVPTFLEEWVISTKAIDVLRSLEYVAFGGGPLSKKTGDTLVAAGVNLTSAYGGTEFGPLTYIIRDPTEQYLWEWVRFGPNQNIRWAPQGDGTYECQVLTHPMHQPSLENLTDVRGYATSDVFVKHSAIEGLYKVVGRLDDVLIHSSGEKTVPAPMETVISASPILSGVCMFGRGRNQTGVLVEPKSEYAIDVTNDEQVAEFRNKIWREVEEANKEASAFSRILKEMVLVTRKEKPMLRAGKGTVIKKATMKLYEPEIDALYAPESSAKAGIDVPLPPTWSQTDVENWLMVHATAVNMGKPIEVDVDVFEQDLDSLSSTFLKNRIIGSLSVSSNEAIQAAAAQISQSVVFSNPTLRLLAQHLIRLLTSNDISSSSQDPKTQIENMIAKYSVGLGDKIGGNNGVPGRSHRRHVVLLTGSTGGLGSYLLASLLSHKDVAVVYTFNRPSNTGTIQHRQHAAFETVDSTPPSSPNLSLDDQMYAKIRDSVTVIIHNAWRLDFNLALSSFESNMRGTRHLIDLARASKWAVKPRFLFTSSVASAQGWNKNRGAFPEEVQFDVGTTVGLGYGASKYVSERILAMSGLPVTLFRIGQITGGAPQGAWSITDWVPIIVKSSVTLGVFPEAHGVVSWLPPHAVSNAILDVAFSAKEPPIAVNLVHSRPTAWKPLMQAISEAVYQEHLTPSLLPLIPFTEWVQRLEKRAMNANEEDVQLVPATKLLEFMRIIAQGDTTMRLQSNPEDVEVAGSPKFATDTARRVSETMRHLAPLSVVDASLWVDYWTSVGKEMVRTVHRWSLYY